MRLARGGRQNDMTDRRPRASFALPEGSRMAVLFNIAFEGWATGAAPSIGPMGNPLPQGIFDTQAASWAAYGHRQGIWRLLRALSGTGIRATVFASGCIAELALNALRAVAEEGHEIAAHGYSQHLIPALMDEEEESRLMEKTIALITGATGDGPSGWLSPRGTPSSETARLAAEHGLVWFGDVFDDDAPYPIPTASGQIVAVPLKMAVNDLPHHVRYGHSPRSFLQAFHDTFAAMYSAGGDGYYMDVTVHAHVFGRPHGAWTVKEIAEHVAGFSDVWVPTRLELAKWTLANLQKGT